MEQCADGVLDYTFNGFGNDMSINGFNITGYFAGIYVTYAEILTYLIIYFFENDESIVF